MFKKFAILIVLATLLAGCATPSGVSSQPVPQPIEDVLISRDKAFKRGRLSFTNEYSCSKCGNTDLEEFYACNDDECWKNLCGVGGMCIFCNRCMDIVEFEQTCIN